MALSGPQRTVATTLGVVFVMGSLGFLSVPLYDLFCRVTGFGGVTQESDTASDTILDQTRPDAQPFYAVRIRTDGKGLEDANGEPLPIIPGMIAEVNIQTGNRRVITSLLKPLLRGTEAFSQR